MDEASAYDGCWRDYHGGTTLGKRTAAADTINDFYFTHHTPTHQQEQEQAKRSQDNKRSYKKTP